MCGDGECVGTGAFARPAKRSEANYHERLNVATAAFGCRTSAARSPDVKYSPKCPPQSPHAPAI
jgi:hypothetical protein